MNIGAKGVITDCAYDMGVNAKSAQSNGLIGALAPKIE